MVSRARSLDHHESLRVIRGAHSAIILAPGP
jgi:hypothetical protein